MKKIAFLSILLASTFAINACSDDDSGAEDIGNPCHCDEEIAKAAGGSCSLDFNKIGVSNVTMPLIFSPGIVGCEKVTAPAGQQVGCMQNITIDNGKGEPFVFKFGGGYCVKGAMLAEPSGSSSTDEKLKKELDPMVKALSVGDVTNSNACPSGTVLMTLDNTQKLNGTFENNPLDLSLRLQAKLCLKVCGSTSDCGRQEGVTCEPVSPFQEKGGLLFVASGDYSEANLKDAKFCIDKSNMSDLSKP